MEPFEIDHQYEAQLDWEEELAEMGRVEYDPYESGDNGWRMRDE
jgi:hypothetical protein